MTCVNTNLTDGISLEGCKGSNFFSHSFLSFKMESFIDGDDKLHCAPIWFYTIVVLINWFLAKNKSRSAGVTYHYTISALKGS